jgi:PhoH-like ATPase
MKKPTKKGPALTTQKTKIYVLDTNVILHDNSCVYQFEEHDIVVPITVLEELDHFKKETNELGYHSREFGRSIDSLAGDKLFTVGVELGEGKGKLFIKLDQEYHQDLKYNFSSDKPDHHILNTAYCLAKENKDRQVILVSKDVNLRMKAKSAGITAQDYRTDHVQNIEGLYCGFHTEEAIKDSIIEDLHKNNEVLGLSKIDFETKPESNEYLILKNGKKSALGRCDTKLDKLCKIDKISCSGITPRNAEQTFALNALLNTDIPLVSISGKAGTGKTLLALAAGLELKKAYRQIYMARPIVPLSNKDIGFLPGDIQAKLDPYMQPLFDNLGVIQNQYSEANTKHKKISELIEDEKLVIAPLAYIRGRSLVKVYFIVDEAQNLTPHEIKTIITRAGEGTKMVFTGDINQIDHPYLDIHSNGLSYLIDKMKGQELYAHITLEKGERSELSELASNLL